jgi:hypothetical protein
MKRFKQGDLAVTVNSRAPLLNSGHVVQILKVVGPVPERKIEFGYEIERIDGLRFLCIRTRDGGLRMPGGFRTIAHQWQLRPIAKQGPGTAARRSRRKIPQTA